MKQPDSFFLPYHPLLPHRPSRHSPAAGPNQPRRRLSSQMKKVHVNPLHRNHLQRGCWPFSCQSTHFTPKSPFHYTPTHQSRSRTVCNLITLLINGPTHRQRHKRMIPASLTYPHDNASLERASSLPPIGLDSHHFPVFNFPYTSLSTRLQATNTCVNPTPPSAHVSSKRPPPLYSIYRVAHH